MTFLRVLETTGPDRDKGPLGDDRLRALIAECGFDEDRDAATEIVEARFETFDGRFRRAGASLTHRPIEKAWLLLTAGGGELREAGSAHPPERGAFGKALRRLARGRGLIAYVGWKRTERVFRGPIDPDGTRPVLRSQEFRFADPVERRTAAGPRVLHLDFPGVPEPGGAVAILMSRLTGAGRGDFDPFVEGCRVLGLPLPGEPVPDEFHLRSDDPFGEVVRKVLAREALTMRRHARGAILDLDPEYVHQLRVASRRARAALRIFRKLLPGPEAQALRSELGWFGQTLGRARDLDVMCSHAPDRARRAALPDEEARIVADALQRRRRAAYEDAARALRSGRYAELLRRMEQFRLPEAAEFPRAEALSPPLIERALRRVEKWERRPAKALPDGEIHRIRIAMKRLRYLGEFFADFQDPRFTRSIRVLVRFQDCLGAFNDAAIASRYLRDLAETLLAERRPDPAPVLAVGALLSVERRLARKHRREFEALWKEFPDESRRLRRRLSRGSRKRSSPSAGAES